MTTDYYPPQPISDEVGLLTNNQQEEFARGLAPQPDSEEVVKGVATFLDQPRELSEDTVRRILADYASGTNKPALRVREQAGGQWNPYCRLIGADNKVYVLAGRDELRKSITLKLNTVSETVWLSENENVNRGVEGPGVFPMQQGQSITFTHTDPIYGRVSAGAGAGAWVHISVERYE